MKKGIVFEALRSINYYLTSKERVSAFANFVLLLIASILDVFGLASLVPIVMAASSPKSVTSNKYLTPIYQGLNFQNEKAFLIFLIIVVFLFFLFKNLFTTWINYRQVRFTAEVAMHIIRRQFNKYTNLPLWVFNNEGSANINNSVVGVPQWYVNGIIRSLFTLFSELAIISIIVISIFIYQPLLFLILVGVLFPSAVLTYQLLKKRSERLGTRLNQVRPAVNMLLLNTFNGFVELKLADKIKQYRSKFLSYQEEAQAVEAKIYLFTLIPMKVIEMVAILGVVTIFLFSLLFEGSSNLITLIGLFAAAAYRVMPSINRVLTALVGLKQTSYAIEELKKYREFDQKQPSEQGQKIPLSFKKEISLKNISFSFPGSVVPALQHINLTVKKGEKIGFIGASGSGKTTLMNLLLRFYQQQEGQVEIDGEPLTDSNKLAWYNIVGYVKQDTFLMESSIKDNITLGEEQVNPEKLNYAIEQASLKDFINSLPEGVDTHIGERGSKLSGGQKQRIGIARALYKNAQVLILDEATSALDNQTEREVSDAIGRLSDTDITILIIAHRITTLRDCDRIYELEQGKIVNVHSYDEVIKKVI